MKGKAKVEVEIDEDHEGNKTERWSAKSAVKKVYYTLVCRCSRLGLRAVLSSCLAAFRLSMVSRSLSKWIIISGRIGIENGTSLGCSRPPMMPNLALMKFSSIPNA